MTRENGVVDVSLRSLLIVGGGVARPARAECRREADCQSFPVWLPGGMIETPSITADLPGVCGCVRCRNRDVSRR